MDFDAYRATAYELVPDSGGAGARRGGAGYRRAYEIVADGVNFATYADRFQRAPQGLEGGRPGAIARCRIRRGGQVTEAAVNTGTILAKGDAVEFVTGGGGGFGAARDRPRDLLARDIADGLVGADAARRDYGMAAAAE
jgi:N-methylhydantoinase B